MSAVGDVVYHVREKLSDLGKIKFSDERIISAIKEVCQLIWKHCLVMEYNFVETLDEINIPAHQSRVELPFQVLKIKTARKLPTGAYLIEKGLGELPTYSREGDPLYYSLQGRSSMFLQPTPEEPLRLRLHFIPPCPHFSKTTEDLPLPSEVDDVLVAGAVLSLTGGKLTRFIDEHRELLHMGIGENSPVLTTGKGPW